MTVFFPFSMFFLSFLPLWISVVFIDLKCIFLKEETCLGTEYCSLAAIGILLLFSFGVLRHGLYSAKKSRANSGKYVIKQAREEKTVTAEYLLAYILPLFAFEFTKWDQMVLFLIFFGTMCLLCLRHNHFSVNIVLELMGYRFFHCLLENEDRIESGFDVISRHCLNQKKGQWYYIRKYNNEYGLEAGEVIKEE